MYIYKIYCIYIYLYIYQDSAVETCECYWPVTLLQTAVSEEEEEEEEEEAREPTHPAPPCSW